MWKVFQTLVIHNDKVDNSFNACVASILELTLRNTCDVVFKSQGSWIDQWRVWLADKGYKLDMVSKDTPPKGYSIATVYTDRTYPGTDASKPAVFIAHSCVAFDGVIIHDPYPLPSDLRDIKYYTVLKPMGLDDKKLHDRLVAQGRCIHGYRSQCTNCKPL